MGISIFASGTINDTNDIQPLIADIEDIAARHGWSYHVINDDLDDEPKAHLNHDPFLPGTRIEGPLGLKGIIVNIGDGAEPFSLLFDRTGVLTDMFQQVLWIENKGESDRFTCCKTQFADIGSHINLIEVLDVVKERYVPGLTVEDEGAYWDQRDRKKLAEKRVVVGGLIRHAEKLVAGIELSDEERRDPNAIAERIEDALRADDTSAH